MPCIGSQRICWPDKVDAVGHSYSIMGRMEEAMSSRTFVTLTLLFALLATPVVAQKNLLDSHPLLVAAYGGENDEVRRLLMRGISTETIDAQYRTPLIWATIAGRTDTVATILKFIPNLNHQDDMGKTALFQAADLGHVDIVDALIAAGADVGIANKEGVSALMAAVRNGDFVTARLLVDFGADVSRSDYAGRTVLEWARGGRSSRLVRMLQKAGAQ